MSKFAIVDYPDPKLDIFYQRKEKKRHKSKKEIFDEVVHGVRKEVNKFDKEFGIKLDDPDIWAQPNAFKATVYANAEYSIRSMICVLNGINPIKYLKSNDGLPYAPESKETDFFRYSVIDWKSKASVDTNTLLFRMKFSSLLLQFFVGNIKKMVRNKCVAKYHSKMFTDEREILMTKEFVNDAIRFSAFMRKDKTDYSNALLKILTWASYLDKKLDQPTYNKTMIDHVVYSRKYAKKDPFTRKPYYDDDDLIEAILHTSYMLATATLYDNNGYIPQTKYIEGATRYHDIILLIEALGGAVLSQSGYQNELAPGYRAFKSANPKIFCAYHKEAKKNRAIKEGIYTMEYLRFVYHDTTMNKFMVELLKKGK